MALLPQKVGSLTLVRALENDGVCQSYVGILNDASGTQVIARQLLPALGRSDDVRAAVTARIADLLPIAHAGLLPLTHTFDHDGDIYLAHEWADAVPLSDVVAWCREHDEPLPLNIFLHVAVQICNALEGLHGRVGSATGAPNVLHLQVRPNSIFLTREGDVLLGNYGLLPGPTFATQTGGFRLKTAYLSPEQTHAEARQARSDEEDSGGARLLSPASDLFSLGAVLYELLVHKPMFEAGTPLRTIAKVRRAEVTTQLLEVKEVFPGVDRVLYRALALNPRHRYQRAFVLREDLRGLMAQFSFSNIQDECRSFLAPLFQSGNKAADELLPKRPTAPLTAHDTEPTVLAKIDVDAIRRGLAASPFDPAPFPEDFDDDLSDYRGDAPTGAFDAPSSPGPLARPVQYAADAPDDNWTDVEPTPALPSALGAMREALQLDEIPEEAAATEENDLVPVDVIDTRPPPTSAPQDETQLLQTVSPWEDDYDHPEETDEAPISMNLLLGAGLASLLAATVTLCGGGMVLGALATQAPSEIATEIEPARGRPAFRPTGKRSWRSVPSSKGAAAPALPAVSDPELNLAVTAMDDGRYRAALEHAHGNPTDLPDVERRAYALLVQEVRGAAHRSLYERSSTPDPEHLRDATLAWSTYRSLAEGQTELVARADEHLAHLAGLQR